MPIDPSIPLAAKAPDADFLGVLGKAAGIQNQRNQARSFEQDFQAKQAIGAAYQAATDPTTGEIDTNKLTAMISQDPRAAFRAGEVTKEALDRAEGQARLTSEQVTAANSHLELMGKAITPLLGSDKPLTKDAVSQAALAIIGNPALPKAMRSQVINDVVGFLGSVPDDDASIRTALKHVQLMNLDARSRYDAMTGVPTATDAGGQVVITQTPQAGGPMQVRGQIDKSRSPEAKAGLVQVYNPATRQMEYRTSGDIVGDAPHVAGQTGGGTSGVAAAPPLGAPAAADVTAHGSAQQGLSLQQAASQVPQRKAALSTMRDQLANFTPGPKADLTRGLGALATQFGLAPPKVAQGVAAQEEFNKLSTQVVLQQVQQLGGAGTDDKLAAGIKGNPSETLTKLGNKRVIALMLGNEDAINAMHDAWEKYSQANGSESYGHFTSEWNRIYDPRVFQAQYMDATQRQALLGGMTKDERAKFDRSVAIARQAGWIGK